MLYKVNDVDAEYILTAQLLNGCLLWSLAPSNYILFKLAHGCHSDGGLGGSDYQLITFISSRTPGENNITLLDLKNTTGYVRLLVGVFTIIYENLIRFAFAWDQVF